MTVSLRVVLDQLVDVVDPDVAEAATQIVRALVATAPRGCDVTAIVPSDAVDAASGIADVSSVTRAPFSRSRLAGSWQLGVTPGIGGGLIHSPSLMAPLVRHDRVNENDQTVVTLWDLCAWESPEQLSRGSVAWNRAMLKRAEKHADAVVVPAHAMIAALSEAAPKLRGRVRVISGAAPIGFSVPADAVGRRRDLGVPDEVIVLSGARCDDEALSAGLAAVSALNEEYAVVVLDVPEGQEPKVQDLAAAAGLRAEIVHPRAALPAADRAAVLDAAVALVAPSSLTAFPWRVVEALTLGRPVVAADSAVHQEILLDGGLAVPPTGLGEALAQILASDDARNRAHVRAMDRGRAFSWRDHADRVWALHAEL